MTDISVAFLGPAHTYSHLAAQTVQPDGALHLPCDTIDQVFAAIETRQARCGLVPLFNTSSGLVSDSVVAIVRRLSALSSAGPVDARELSAFPIRPTAQLCISASMVVAIEHCLVSWGTLDSIRVVSSKQQALEQCRHWLDQHLPDAHRLATDSSAAALHELQRHPEHAAIVSRPASRSLAAPLCLMAIQDQVENATEFVVVQLDADPKPVLDLSLQGPTRDRFEYLIAEVDADGRETVWQPIQTQTASLGPWSGCLSRDGVWYEARKRPIARLLDPHQPWTGELTGSGEPAASKSAPHRVWRLGIG